MGPIPSLGECLRSDARHPCHRRSTSVHQPALFRVWHQSQEESLSAHPHLPELWTGARPRSQRCTEHSLQGMWYRGAHGNQWACPMKRLGTGDRYGRDSSATTASRLEEPRTPLIDQGECQTSPNFILYSYLLKE